MMLVKGLGNTLLITLCALLIGIVIGSVIAIAKYYAEGNKKLKIVNVVCDIYTTAIRGIPVTVLLMIFYFVIIVSDTTGITTAIIAFGINSGAYIAEIVRSGIMSINPGQMEAGRSLGFNYAQTMWHIILPQAIKNILPALGNEMITLLKDTSLVSVIALRDVTMQTKNVANLTYDVFVPYIALALIYLVIVVALTKLLNIFERRLRKSER